MGRGRGPSTDGIACAAQPDPTRGAQARMAGVCTRWRELVMGEANEAHLWRTLYARDFEPLVEQGPARTLLPPRAGVAAPGPAARHRYGDAASVDGLVCPTWIQLYAKQARQTVGSRQGCAGCVLRGELVVYGGWTNGWQTIRNDINLLHIVDPPPAPLHTFPADGKDSEAGAAERTGRAHMDEVGGAGGWGGGAAKETAKDVEKKELKWEAVKCSGSAPTASYGPTITTASHPEHGDILLVFGGVRHGGYQGPINDLRMLVPAPASSDAADAPPHQGPGGGGEGKTDSMSGADDDDDDDEPSGGMGVDNGTPRAYHTATWLQAKGGGGGGRLLVMGGFSEGDPLLHLEACEIGHGPFKWSAVDTMGTAPCPRFGHSASLVGPDASRLVVIGGCTGGHNHKGNGTDGHELRDVHILTLAPGEDPLWTSPMMQGVPPRGAVARCHTAVVVGGNILCFAGGPSFALSNSLSALDTRDFTWKEVKQAPASQAPPRERHNPICVPVCGGSEVLVFGGWRGEELGDLYSLKFGTLEEGQHPHGTSLSCKPPLAAAQQDDEDDEDDEDAADPRNAHGTRARMQQRMMAYLMGNGGANANSGLMQSLLAQVFLLMGVRVRPDGTTALADADDDEDNSSGEFEAMQMAGYSGGAALDSDDDNDDEEDEEDEDDDDDDDDEEEEEMEGDDGAAAEGGEGAEGKKDAGAPAGGAGDAEDDDGDEM
ncbi:hypothetical protein T484DRAFT_1826541 [Baffinella frigidus]|nr:hypothetical protein T484DRAFT_1826541 [Cryptophyta sp. CCMP2293]